MKNKFFGAMLIVFTLTTSMVIPSYAANNANTVIVLNIGKPTMLVSGVEKNIDMENKVTPVLINDTTMVPIRAIVESMGGSVEWNDDEQKATVLYQNNKVEVWINKTTALVNGKEANITVPPTFVNDRIMIPLRFVSESLGLCVNWEGSSEAISISPTSDYLAIAGGQIVNKSEYNIYLNTAKKEVMNLLSQYNITTAPDGSIWNNNISGMKAGDLAKKKAMNYAVNFKILLSKAKESNTTLSDDEIKNIDAYVAKQIQDYGNVDVMEKKLNEEYNINLFDYTEYIKGDQLIKKYLQGIMNQIVISDDVISNAYEKYKPMFDKVTVQHILIKTIDSNGTPLSSEKQDEAKKKAEDILSKIKAGQDFATLAKQYSEDTGSKDSGGEYTFAKGEMVKEFEDWSFQAKDGDVGIIKSAYGYHVMKFISRTTENDIKASIQNQLTNEALNSYIKKVLSDYSSVTVINQSVYNAVEVK